MACAFALASLAACTTQSPTSQTASAKTTSKEYFSEAACGVKASPRVTTKRSGLPRGGGREQVGKPYKVRGKWYYPKEQPEQKQVGSASWYGDAFHGRLTANGEVYDMTHLTAAHPTMPLPSYARVTNLENGSSVIVRVNDRGPYSNGRIIDLSKRAADLLDYTHGGTAKVEVEYVGRAPLEGQDDEFLLASYRPAGAQADPSEGLPTGVMIAMNGATPSQAATATPFPGVLNNVDGTAPAQAPAPIQIELPAHGPIAPERPAIVAAAGPSPALSFAPVRTSKAADALAALATEGAASMPTAGGKGYIAVGTFGTEGEAAALVRALESKGRVVAERSREGGRTWWSVSVAPDGRASLDDLLSSAWAAGAEDAFPVRD